MTPRYFIKIICLINFVWKLIKNGGIIQLTRVLKRFQQVFNHLKCFAEINVETLYAARSKSKIKTEVCIMFRINPDAKSWSV